VEVIAMNEQDRNEVSLTGSIDRLKRINTKTGNDMAEIILVVRKDRFRVIAHGNVAEYLLVAAGPGDRLTATGTLTISSWKDESTGEWRNSFAVTAWAVEIHGNKVAFQRKHQDKPRKSGQRCEIPTVQPGDPF
jgi:hypothetical protein